MSFHAIIPAGGAGTRLWPLSRASAPKFLVDLTGAGRTMLQQTVDRLAPLAGDSITVVTGVAHEAAVREQVPQADVIAEISPRDSMAAIGLAAAVIEARDGDTVVGSFAADHLIQDEDAFRTAVRSAISAAEAGYLVTIGITPDYAATGFGYIHATEPTDVPGAFHVGEFLEKPAQATAEAYLATGEYKWNAGMFISRTSVLLGALERFQPELAAGLREIADAWDTPSRDAVVSRVWPTLTKIAIDHAIAEPLAAEGGVAVVPVEMGWSDVGDYASLRDVLDDPVQVAPGGSTQDVLLEDSPGALVYTHSKPIVVAGVENAVVVETEDVFLVTTRENAQQVKNIVGRLDEIGRSDLR